MLLQLALLLSFVAAVGLVYYLELRWLLFRWLNRREAPPPRFWPFAGERTQRLLSALLHAAAFVGLLCILYGFLVEPTRLEVTKVEFRSPKVRGPVRIVLLSDFHSEAEPLNERRAVELVRGLKPDLIAVTGDFVNDAKGVPTAVDAVRELCALARVFLVTGNYDLGLLPDKAFQGLPARLLDVDYEDLEVRGTPLRVSGMLVGMEPFFPRFMAKLPASPAYHVFLSHYTDLAFEAEKAGVDLYLAGHTHGGQVRLPFYGALVTLSKHGKRFEAGLYRVGRMALYVNRGLGLEGGRAPRVRFLCRPEVTVIDLLPG